MKINRRGLFALGGGAAIAGPKIAAGMAQEMTQAAPSGMDYASKAAFNVMKGAGQSGLSDPLYVMEHAANLRKVISGERSKKDLQDEERRRLQDTTIVYHNIEALKSVSAGHRFTMSQLATRARYEEANKRQAAWTLRDLQEQFPLLNLLG